LPDTVKKLTLGYDYNYPIKEKSKDTNQNYSCVVPKHIKKIIIDSDYINKIDEKIKSFDESGNIDGLFYKFMDKNDLERTGSLPLCIDNKTNFNEFTKTKYSNVYLIIELNLDESGEKKLLLFKSVKKHYSIKSARFKNFLSVPLFDQDNTHKIKFIDSQSQLILDDNFEIIAFINESVEIPDILNKGLEDSFFIIRNRMKFEDFYGYHENYEKAFTSISSRFDFIDWDVARESISMKRICYAVDNFPHLDKCISQLKVELISGNENEVKKAFSSKGINYAIDGENIKITPKNIIAFRSLFKIMTDVLSKTCLLKRSMLGEEELIVSQ